MSTVAPPPRLGWRLLPAIVAAAAAVIAASLLIAALREHPSVVSLGRAVSQQGRPQPVVTAAPWRVAGFSVGAGASLSKKEKARLEVQKPRARRVARDIAHGVTLATPGRLAKIRGLLTPAAARSIRRAAPGLPKKATAVEAVARSGQIGLQAPRFNTAVARLQVKVKAVVDRRAVRWKDSVTLWLARDNNVWKAIAFDIERKPR